MDRAVSNLCDSECLADRKRWARFLPLFCGADAVAARAALVASWSIRLCQTKTGGSASETAEIRFYAARHRHFADRMSQSA